MNAHEKIAELHAKGFCVLRGQLPTQLIDACRQALWPILLDHLERHRDKPNRGPHRHFLPMPFHHPCFAREFLFNAGVLKIVRGAMDERVVADQWGCDVPLCGSENQQPHVDYQRLLFPDHPEVVLPPYMLVVSFGLIPITQAQGPIQIAPGTHRMSPSEAFRALQAQEVEMLSVPLEVGDVLIRHPWAMHRGTPNTTETPRPLLTIRYVRRWYADDSREVNTIPQATWQSLTPEERSTMRFPVAD